jgi:hypothetical protein
VNTLRRAALAPAREVAHGPRPELVLDRFRLLEPLGSGGHGTVWAARDERLRRVVALKRIPRGHGSSAADRRRIDREALAAARLAHPAIVSFYEALSDEDAYYLVSELVEGSSLAQRYARNRPDEGELVAIGAALADALAHAHARGVVHRDVKPQNVIVAADPVATGARAKLTDFGVALIAGEQPLTQSGDVIGTLAYMSPEQAHGHPATPASDLYALALTLYEGFAGHNPLRGASAIATVKRLGQTIAPLGAARPDLPRRLTSAIDRALDRDPARRGSVGDLQTALGAPRAATTARLPRRARNSAQNPLTPRAQRLVAAVGAAVMTAAAQAAVLGPHSGMTIVLSAAAALLVVCVAPRAGWLALVLAGASALALAGKTGAALLVLCALAPAPALLPGEVWLWSAPALAPALGGIGLAAAFPALAARIGGVSAGRRVALGLLGYWWTELAGALAGRRMLLGLPASTRPAARWLDSPAACVDRVLLPLLRFDRIAPGLLWAVAALILPWLLRTARGWPRALLASAWAGVLIGATVYLAQRAGAGGPPLALAAAVLAAVLALTLRGASRGPARPGIP